MSNRGKVIIGVLLVGTVIALLAFGKKKEDKDIPDPDDVDTSEPTGTTPPVKGFPLKRGSRGNNVKSLQRFLNYSDSSYNLKTDKVFGPLTEAAVLNETGKKIVHKDYFDTFISGKF